MHDLPKKKRRASLEWFSTFCEMFLIETRRSTFKYWSCSSINLFPRNRNIFVPLNCDASSINSSSSDILISEKEWRINICHGILCVLCRRFDVDRSLRDTRKLAMLTQSGESRSRKQIYLLESLNFGINFESGKSILLFKLAVHHFNL